VNDVAAWKTGCASDIAHRFKPLRTARPGVETPFVTLYTMVLLAASSVVSSSVICEILRTKV
jgi:hypothetical protein